MRFNVKSAGIALVIGINPLVGCESTDGEIPTCYVEQADGSLAEFYASDYGGEDAAMTACQAAQDELDGGAPVTTASTEEGDVAFDVEIMLQPLEAFGGIYDRMLGVHTDLFAWNPATSDTCFVGYNAVGGSEDWLPEHCVVYVDEILEVDGDGDGTGDARFAAVEFDESTQPYLGNLLNVGNEDCWDTTSEYYSLEGCWAKVYLVGGDDFTAWVGSGTDIGDYEISVESNEDGLRPGPDNGI